jgi:hypothetical protein
MTLPVRDGVMQYRITLAPDSRTPCAWRGQQMVALTIEFVLDFGELNAVRHAAEDVARHLMGDQWQCLRVARVDRLEASGQWCERIWPIPAASSVDDLLFSKDGALLTNICPTWPH